jgi:hypothetical protein
MAGYIGPQPVPQATQHRQSFVATANQTSFATAGYTPQFLDLYLNGVKLAGEDYTATNGSDVVLATGAAVGDILEYVAYTPFEVANQTFTGTTSVDALNVSGNLEVQGLVYKDGPGALSVGSGDVGLNFDPASDFIIPITVGGGTVAGRDAAINLGRTNTRFRDLYLSGGVYLGGTGAANKLDDYEEGFWSPRLGGSDNTASQAYAYQRGRYSKIGNMVTVSFDVQMTNRGTLAGNAVVLDLPFTSVAAPFNYKGTASVGYFSSLNANYIYVSMTAPDGDNRLIIRALTVAAASIPDPAATSFWTNSTRFIGGATYFVD